jgi:dTDP-4-amino-4,6-dideoxygalactose transaminase
MTNSDESAAQRLFLSPPHLSGKESRLVEQAFESNYIAPLGPMVDAFEREFCERVGITHGVALSSGTAACHLALRLLGVGPGDVVLASTLTFIGSVTPVLFQGAIPIFVDADRTSWNMDPDLLQEALEYLAARGVRPKAVLPTDLYGQCADYDRIQDTCDRYDIPVIVDAAEALGAGYKGRHAGSGARAAFFSFNGNKILTTSGGGMLVSDDRELIEKARFFSQQARDAAPHYEHTQYGYNYRMSNLLAAVGRGQLPVLDERVRRKREICDHYQRLLADIPGITFMPEVEYGRATRWLTVILITPETFGADREAVRLALEELNIESRPVWKPMHLQPVFCGDAAGHDIAYPRHSLPLVIGGGVSEDLFNRGLCLPSGTQMSMGDIERVALVIRSLARLRPRVGVNQ